MLGLVLHFSRPDLVGPMLGHLFGYVLVGAVGLLTLAGAAVQAVNTLGADRTRGSRIGVGVVGCIVFTGPAVFLLLFGPVAFGFMFGGLQ